MLQLFKNKKYGLKILTAIVVMGPMVRILYDLIKNDNTFSLLSVQNVIVYILGFFKPVAVEGHLDDLVGQQLFIHFLLIFVVIGLIIMFSFYLLLHIVYYSKDFIIKRFDNNNRFIKLYLRYQVILSKISLIILPVFILLGLIELFVGLHFLITHPIPYEELPVDLHTYISLPSAPLEYDGVGDPLVPVGNDGIKEIV